MPQRDDGGAGDESEARDAGSEPFGGVVGGVPAPRDAAFGVDHHNPAGGEGLGSEIECCGCLPAPTMNRHVPFPGKEAAQDGNSPQSGGGESDGLGAQAAQGGQNDAGIDQRGVVGRYHAARGDRADRTGGHGQPAQDGDQGAGEGGKHELPFLRCLESRMLPAGVQVTVIVTSEIPRHMSTCTHRGDLRRAWWRWWQRCSCAPIVGGCLSTISASDAVRGGYVISPMR